MANNLPSLKHFFRAHYRGNYDWTYNTISQFLVGEYVTDPFQNLHYSIEQKRRAKFDEIIHQMAADLYSPFNEDNSVMREYELEDIAIMKEGRTRPIRVTVRHPDLPDEPAFRKTFYIKRSSETNPRLTCSYLYKIFSLYHYNMWANDHLIITSEAPGTVSSRLPAGRMDELLQETMFLREAIRCNVETSLMLLADMYPKNFVTRRVLNKDMDARWEIVPIDFDRAFYPEDLTKATLIVPEKNNDPKAPERNLLKEAIQEHFSERAMKVIIRNEEERLGTIYLGKYEELNLLFDILKTRKFSSFTFKDLNKQFVELYGFGVTSSYLGDLIKNSFDYLLYRLSH